MSLETMLAAPNSNHGKHMKILTLLPPSEWRGPAGPHLGISWPALLGLRVTLVRFWGLVRLCHVFFILPPPIPRHLLQCVLFLIQNERCRQFRFFHKHMLSKKLKKIYLLTSACPWSLVGTTTGPN